MSPQQKDRTLLWLLVTGFALMALVLLALRWAWNRDVTRARHLRDLEAQLAQTALHQRDTVVVLRERYRTDTLWRTKTSVVYRQAVQRLDSAPPLVTARGDSVRVDTTQVVRDFRLACSDALAARDTVISVCEQRLEAQRRLAVTDSSRQAVRYRALQLESKTVARDARRQGRVQGAVGTVLVLALAGFAVKQLHF